MKQVEPGCASSTGRVDETILSKLRTIRTFLYGLLYSRRETFDGLLGLFSALPMFELESVIEAMATLHPLLDALMQLLAHDQTDVAPSKLRQLMKQQGRLVLKINENTTGQSTAHHVVRLEHQIGSTVMMKSLAELLDFQSTLVLAPAAGVEERDRERMDFIQLLTWTQSLAESVLKLHCSGHFDYVTWEHTIPLAEEPEAVRVYHKLVEQQLSQWEAVLAEKRISHYYLNFFSMASVSRLVALLTCGEASEEALQPFLWLVSPQSCSLDGALFKFAQQLRNEWKVHQTEPLDALAKLEAVGSAVNSAGSLFKLRERPVDPPCRMSDATDAGMMWKSVSDVGLLCCSPGEVLEHVLSAYTW